MPSGCWKIARADACCGCAPVRQNVTRSGHQPPTGRLGVVDQHVPRQQHRNPQGGGANGPGPGKDALLAPVAAGPTPEVLQAFIGGRLRRTPNAGLGRPDPDDGLDRAAEPVCRLAPTPPAGRLSSHKAAYTSYPPRSQPLRAGQSVNYVSGIHHDWVAVGRVL